MDRQQKHHMNRTHTMPTSSDLPPGPEVPHNVARLLRKGSKSAWAWYLWQSHPAATWTQVADTLGMFRTNACRLARVFAARFGLPIRPGRVGRPPKVNPHRQSS